MLLNRQLSVILQIGLLLFVISCVDAQYALRDQTAPKQCARFGEYCQTHLDCCTKICLTYLYRCTRSYSNIYPYPFLSPQYEQPGYNSYTDVLDNTFGEYQPNVVTYGRQTRAIEDQVKIVAIDAAGDKESSSESAAKVTETDAYETITEVAANTEQPTESSNAIEPEDSDTRQQCKAVGSKCYRNEECCTVRCHGFLHQCVT
ncbi:uncharacterized protein LOC115621549 [Scaptodrosophila lebanonensis]|uniref:Uncharacterized protein LOC115621549 n=1 Tax=Drosophila lebanonensis TaxID=7225 RepID=A0A6J2T801_DROLE|nr:uncharacterized protein LOC115621549 [Scaptodrosophila lebanonensis]